MRPPVRAAFAGALISALITIPGLGSGTLWDNSETAYGEVAREILIRGDWIVLHLNGFAWYVQPPLYFWLAAFCAKVFGVGAFALRLPSALATMAMGAMAGYAVTRQAGERAGMYAAVILSTCLMQAVVGRLAIMDALLDLAVAFAVFWWFRALQTGRSRYLVYGWLAAALGFLAKGPVAPVSALMVIVPYYFWEVRATRVKLPSWRGWALGAALFALICAPWFAALYARAGAGAVSQLIGYYTFGRYTQTIENQSGPLWYYLPVLILGFFPWIAYIPSALAFASRRLRGADAHDAVTPMLRLALVWAVVPLVFFSFAKTKLPNYIALEFPALALLVALYFDAAFDRARSRSALISTAAVPLTIALLAIAIVLFSNNNRLTADLRAVAVELIFVGAAIVAGSLIAFGLLVANRAPSAAPHVLGVAMVLAVAFLAILAMPQAERFKPVPHLAKIIDARLRPGDAVAIQDLSGGNALVFYTRPRVYVLTTPGEQPVSDGFDPHRVICGSPRIWVIAPAMVDETYGRARRAIARWGKAELFLYSGRKCTA